MDLKDLKQGFLKMVRRKYVVAIILFFAWIIFFDENSVVSHQRNRQRLNELTEQKAFYREQIIADKQKLEDLNSGIANLEKFAREQYFMSKPDEDVFVVVEK